MLSVKNIIFCFFKKQQSQRHPRDSGQAEGASGSAPADAQARGTATSFQEAQAAFPSLQPSAGGPSKPGLRALPPQMPPCSWEAQASLGRGRGWGGSVPGLAPARHAGEGTLSHVGCRQCRPKPLGSAHSCSLKHRGCQSLSDGPKAAAAWATMVPEHSCPLPPPTNPGNRSLEAMCQTCHSAQSTSNSLRGCSPGPSKEQSVRKMCFYLHRPVPLLVPNYRTPGRRVRPRAAGGPLQTRC